MKNANQIRQLLNKAQDYARDSNIKRLDSIDANQTYKWIMQDMFKCVSEVLTLLLPCETCNDTKQVRRVLGEIKGLPLRDYVGSKIPCSDFQPTEKLLGFQEILDCWSVHPIDDKDCVSCPQMYKCQKFRKDLK